MSRVGIDGTALSWIASCLIQTRVGNSLSSKLPITSGVPQGSVLGPLLFIIHYKDIPAATKTTTALFADDTLRYRAKCCGANRTLCCELSVDLREFECWAQSSNIPLNASKLVELVLGPRPPPTAAFLNGEHLQRVQSQSHLGITISKGLRGGKTTLTAW